MLWAPATQAQLLQRPLAVENARILTMHGAVVENGTLLVKGEKIIALGANVKVPLLAKKFDAQGGTVSPGLIDPLSTLGAADLTRGGAGSTRRAEDAFDGYDTAALVDALRNGVTAFYLGPSGSPGVGGTGAVLRLGPGLGGKESFGRVLQPEAALCVDLGSGSSAVTRLKTLAAVRKQFRSALDYREKIEQYEEKLAEYKKKLKEQKEKKEKKEPPKKEPAKKEPTKKEPPKPKDKPPPPKTTAAAEEDEKKEEKKEEGTKADAKTAEDDKPKKPPRPPRNPAALVLLRAIDHEIPVRIRAQRSEDILNALELAEEFKLDLILEGGAEAHLVADQIADAEVPVVLGSMARAELRQDDPFRRAIPRSGTALSAAGVRWVAGSGAETAASARFVALSAQLADADGRDGKPLKSVTADAADTLRVADRIGRLRPGLLADFVVWSTDPLDPAAKVLRVYVGGTLVYQASDESKKGESK